MNYDEARPIIEGMLKAADHRPEEASEKAFWLRLRWAAGLFDHDETPDGVMARIQTLQDQAEHERLLRRGIGTPAALAREPTE